MKYLLCRSIPPENYNAAVDAFLEGGAPTPEGFTSPGRWHAPGSTRGWLLCEADDPVAAAHHVAQWAGLLKIDNVGMAEPNRWASKARRIVRTHASDFAVNPGGVVNRMYERRRVQQA